VSSAECSCAIADEGGCQRIFDELIARDFSNVLYGRWHRTLVDVYALQHPERYCVSAKSLAAHLGGLCCAIERGGDAETYRALQRWLNGPSALVRPPIPAVRGAVTIADLLPAGDPREYGEALGRWAQSTWAAYSPLHGLARAYLDAANSR
jgi:hypothetical protein